MNTQSSLPVYQAVWRLIRYRPGLYLSNIIAWVAIAQAELAAGLVVKTFFDLLTGEAPFGFNLWSILALTIGVALAHIVFITAGALIDSRHRFTMSTLLRRNLLAAILARPGAAALPSATGEALNTIHEDVETIEDSISWLVDQVATIAFACVALVIMLRIDARITFFTLLPLAIIVVIARATSTRIGRFRQSSRLATQRLTGALGEVLGATQAIQVAGAEEHVLEHVRRLNAKRLQAMVRDRLLNQVLDSFFTHASSLGIGVILLLVAGEMQNGDFSVGDFALFTYYLSYLTEFFTHFGSFLAHYKQAEVAVQRMVALLQGAPVSQLVAHEPIYLDGALPVLSQPSHSASERLQRLEVSGLTYHYPSNGRSEEGAERSKRPGIEAINLRLERGSFTVITGRIGAGKTTLLRVLLGLLPKEAGEICWNGQVISDPATFFTPPHSAYTPQIPQLFSASLGENLSLGLPVSAAQLESAMQQAVLERDVAEMTAGLETVVGTKGVRLSGGQIQRTAAARMFVRQPDLLVVDDLSSALDVNTEQALWERLFALTAQGNGATPTCLVVSHRRAALQRADHIVVLKDGKVEDEGDLAGLLGRCQEMQRLWQDTTQR